MTTEKYISRIASQHKDKPKFKAFVDLYASACVDIQNVLLSLIKEFDLDYAVGRQLDIVGEWIGQSRKIPLIAEQIYFTWDDTPQKGWDNGRWKGIGDPDNEQIILDDGTYRRLLRAKVLSNIWKGNADGIYEIFDAFVNVEFSKHLVSENDIHLVSENDIHLVSSPSHEILLIDNGDMSMKIIVVDDGLIADLDIRIIISNLIIVQPAGVSITYVVI
jgi:hypothetical protein